jgi:primosomal protein N' (replication factor Y)
VLEAAAPQPSSPRFVASHTPTADQAQAVERIGSALGRFQTFLLHGITGSGKTEVYLRLIARVLEKGNQALVLVPEISLTPQLEGRFRHAFPQAHIVLLHSALQDVPRTAAWLAAARGEAGIVLGTRLATLTPLPRLALVVVDEEHDTSFKQQEGLRYSGRDAAVMRAKFAACPVVLGTATPSLETWHNALAGRYERISLPDRAVPGARLPKVRTLDLKLQPAENGFAPGLIAAIGARLARHEQSLIFINRRGYAPVLACHACGWTSGCERCTARMVLHKPDRRLRCHHCGAESAIPRACPTCGNVDLKAMGRGTQRVEETLETQFPRARIVRIDRDSARRRTDLARTLEGITRGEADILVGTQLLAKGHDFPLLTLVGVLDADGALLSTDYRSAERLYATLAQVAGRAGRREQPGEVLVQTRYAQHPLYASLASHDFAAFATAQLAEREAAGFPPFVHEAALRAEAHKLATAMAFLEDAARLVPVPEAVRVYDPVPHVITRRADMERAQLLVQSASRPALQDFLHAWTERLFATAPRSVRWHLDVDPIEFD